MSPLCPPTPSLSAPVMVVPPTGPWGWLSAVRWAECDAPGAPAAFPWTSSFVCAETSVCVSDCGQSRRPRAVSALLVFLCQGDECGGLAVSADR